MRRAHVGEEVEDDQPDDEDRRPCPDPAGHVHGYTSGTRDIVTEGLPRPHVARVADRSRRAPCEQVRDDDVIVSGVLPFNVASIGHRRRAAASGAHCRQNSLPSGSAMTIQKRRPSCLEHPRWSRRALELGAAPGHGGRSGGLRPDVDVEVHPVLAVLPSGTFWNRAAGRRRPGRRRDASVLGAPRPTPGSRPSRVPVRRRLLDVAEHLDPEPAERLGVAASNVTWTHSHGIPVSGRRGLHLAQLLLHARDLVAQPGRQLELQLAAAACIWSDSCWIRSRARRRRPVRRVRSSRGAPSNRSPARAPCRGSSADRRRRAARPCRRPRGRAGP